MAGLLDIGTLSGNIEISEQIAATAGKVNAHLDSIGSKFDGITKGLVVGSAAIVGALGGIAAGIVTLGEKGSTILGVEEAFDRLAVSIGQTGEALIGGLSAGVRDTVDSFELMKSANRALSAGVKLTAEDMRTLGATAREMAKAAGTDAASELDKLFSAMTTGRVRGLQLAGVMVNVRDAQAKFAASLGVTADKLNEEGRLHAVRIAILEKAREKLNQLGESQLSFKERIDQAQVAFGNWVDNLSKAIAKSPAVNKAFDDVAKAIEMAFGDKGQGLINALMKGVDAFAGAVSKAAAFIGPLKDGIMSAIDQVKGFWQWLVDLNEEFKITDTVVAVVQGAFSFLRGAFDLVRNAALAVVAAWRQMPDWLREIARQAVATGLGLAAVGVAAGAATGPIVRLVNAADQAINIFGNLVTGLVSFPQLLDKITKSQIALTVAQEAGTVARWANIVATRAATVAEEFWAAQAVRARVVVVETNLVMGASLATTNSLAKAKNFLGAAIIALNTNFQTLLKWLGIHEIALAASTRATQLLTAAKNWLILTLVGLNFNINITLARLGLMTGGLTAAEAAAKATTVALGILGTVLAGAAFVVSAVAVKELATQLGRAAKAEEEAAAQGRRMEFLKFIAKDIAGQFQDMASVLTLGLIPRFHEAKDAARKLAQEGFDPVADAIKRIKDEASGAAVASELEILRRAWNALTPEQKASEQAIRSTGEALQGLIARGAKLHPEMKELRDSFKLLQSPMSETIDKSRFLKGGMDAASEAVKNLADELSGARLLGSVKELNRAWASLTEEQRKSPEAIDRMLQRVRALVAQGALPALSKEAHKLAVEHGLLRDMLPKVNANMFDMLNTSQAVTVAYEEQARSLEELLAANEKFRSFRPIVGGSDPFSFLNDLPGVITNLGKAPNLLRQFFIDLKAQFTSFGEQLGPTILQAITGGGDVGRSVGALAGQHLGKTLVSSFGGFISKHLGSTLGDAINSVIPGVGALLGSLVGSLFDKIPWKTLTRNIARDMQDAFATQELGFGNLAELSATLAKMGSAGAALSRRLDVAQRRDDEKATAAAIEDVRKFLAALDSDIQRYNLTWADIADPFERMKRATAGADALVTAFDRLKGSGFTAASIVKGMKEDLNDWLAAAIKAGTGIPPQIGEIIKQLVISKQLTEDNARALLGLADDGMPALKDIEEAAARYGLTLDELGPKVQQLRITEAANQIVKDFELLMKAGVPFEVLMRDAIPGAAGEAEDGVAEAVAGMKKQIQDLVSKALSLGLKLPESMRPIIQRLIDAGGLVDEFGEKLTDTSRLNFEVPLVERIDDLILAIQGLIEEFKKLSPAVETEVDKGITAWERFRRAIAGPLPSPTFTGPSAPSPPSPSAPEPTGLLFPQPVGPAVGFPSGTNITIVALDSQSAQEWLERGDNAETFTNAIVPRIPKAVEFYQRGVGQ